MKPVQALNHVGIAVRSIEEQRPYYESTLGAEFEGVEELPDHGVRVAFFRIGEVRLELLEPLSPDSLIHKFLERRGEGLHHLAFTVDDLQARIDELQANGLRWIDTEPRAGAKGMQIAFLHPDSTHGVLTEFCQPD